ncbi:hypothetical protein K501DRAFT_274414 [Backusella circina FSU 941]|nr:hypothetical protein K501DRAFT_274414 [Backusella circina FSU 941]
MMQYAKKKKKYGKIPPRTSMPYYFATKRPSFKTPIQPSLPPNMTPALYSPLAYLTPSLSPSLNSIAIPTMTSTLASDYTYTSTLAHDYTHTSTPMFTPSPLPTPKPETVKNTSIILSSDEDTMPEDTSQSDENQNNDDSENPDFSDVNITVDENNHNAPTISAAAAIARGSNNAQTGTLASPNQTMQIAGPILGIVGAMAIVAAAMFFVVRKRRNVSHNKDESDDFELPKDTSSPPIIPPSIVPTREEEEMNEKRFSHGTGTLVGSSRSNSTIKQKHMSISSWYSASSSILEMPSLPSSEVMLAERQQLQHERPSLLDHWKKPILIETYRAQLTDLSDITDTI